MPPSLLSRHNYWHEKEATTKIDVECLLPNGICISFPLIRADTTLEKIKGQLWNEASRYPLFRLLRPKSEYVFHVVSSKGGIEELIDEAQSLFDVKPVRPYLKIVQRQGDEEEKLINSKISMLIGRSITSSSKNEEVDDLRGKCIEFCQKISYARGRATWERRAIYTYPPEFEDDGDLPVKLKEKLAANGNRLHLTVSVLKNISNTFEIPDTYYPHDLIEVALQKRAHTLKQSFVENADDYILKVVGRLNFFLGHVVINDNGSETYMEKPILQYKVGLKRVYYIYIPSIVMYIINTHTHVYIYACKYRLTEL